MEARSQFTNRVAYSWYGAAYGARVLNAAFQQYPTISTSEWFADTGESVHHWYEDEAHW